MPKISTYKISKGERILLSENEVSQEQYDRMKERFDKMKKEKKERMQRKFDEVPEIHWEILRFANTHKKEEADVNIVPFSCTLCDVRIYTVTVSDRALNMNWIPEKSV